MSIFRFATPLNFFKDNFTYRPFCTDAYYSTKHVTLVAIYIASIVIILGEEKLDFKRLLTCARVLSLFCFVLLFYFLFFNFFSSANASPEFEGRGGDELGAMLAKSLEKAYNHKSAIDLESLCILPGKQCWVLYIDALVQ